MIPVVFHGVVDSGKVPSLPFYLIFIGTAKYFPQIFMVLFGL